MALFFIIFLTVYTSLNFYVFIRGWQVISAYPILKPIYAILFIVIAYGYVIAKVLYKYLHPLAYDIILGFGAIWFAFLAYFILSLLLIDILRLFNGWFLFFPSIITNNYENAKRITAIILIALVGLIVFLGNLNKRNIEIRNLEITIPKGESKLNSLNVVMA